MFFEVLFNNYKHVRKRDLAVKLCTYICVTNELSVYTYAWLVIIPTYQLCLIIADYAIVNDFLTNCSNYLFSYSR